MKISGKRECSYSSPRRGEASGGFPTLPPRTSPATRGRKILTALLLISSILLNSPIHSRAAMFVGPGATGAPFLKIPLAARGTALAGAFTAGEGDLASLEYNPAGLYGLNRTHIDLTHIQFLQETTLQSVSVGFPVPLRFLEGRAPSDPEAWHRHIDVGLHYRLLRSNDTARNEVGVKLGDFDLRDQLLQIGAAAPIFSRLRGGGSFKYISSTIQNDSVTNFAFDAGLLFRYSPTVSFGGSLLNIGSEKAFVSEKDPLPTTLRAGASYQAKRYLVLADFSHGKDKISQEALGVEWNIHKYVRLRLGSLYHKTVEFSGGLGILIPRLSGKHKNRPKNRYAGKKPARTDNRQKKDPWNFTSVRQPAPSVDFGLDYAIRTHDELGLSHNITLKILY